MMSGDHLFSLPSSVSHHHHQEAVLLDPTNPSSNLKHNPSSKKRRNLPGTPDPDAEVIALSPTTLMATNRFVCEICNKGFQRDQNLQLHRRGHNLPWKLKQRNKQELVKKKVYICPEKSCVHHEASRALGDLTGIKKHFSRKHGEKKWKCEKCSKKYAVQSDWKAHSKTCGTREYKCDCGTLFSRKDSFITHRAFCDALAEESARITSVGTTNNLSFNQQTNLPRGNSQTMTGYTTPADFGCIPTSNSQNQQQNKPRLSLWLDQTNPLHMSTTTSNIFSTGFQEMVHQMSSSSPNVFATPAPQGGASMSETLSSMYSHDNQNHQPAKSISTTTPMSATALLQKAAQMGSTKTSPTFFNNNNNTFGVMSSSSSSSNTHPSFINSLIQHRTEDGLIGCPNMSSDSNTKAMNLDQAFLQTGGVHTQGGGSLNLDNSLTRDFLGMSNEGGRPFLAQELAKFASMSSAMGLSHYSSSGH